MKVNRWTVPDIHGCYRTFEALLSKIDFQPADHLYLLGDFMDKNAHAYLVIDKLIELTKEGYNIHPIRGNHEENYLKACTEFDDKSLIFYIERLGKNNNLLKDGKPVEKYFNWIKALPYYIETADYIFTHASVKPGPDFSDTEHLLYNYRADLTHDELGGKTLLRGHKVTNLEDIEKTIAENAPVISLDNGCVYVKKHKIYDVTKVGNLCAFNLDTRELIVQPNLDPPAIRKTRAK